MDGFLLIDKPSGPSSFDVVRAVRRAAKVRKVGHTGTLDPLASGILAVGLGQGTKLIHFLQEGDKAYRGEIALGDETDTDDALGEVVDSEPVPALTRARVDEVLAGFVGAIRQEAPRYSALKDGGEPQYKKARRGEQVVPKIREVNVEKIDVISLGKDRLEIDVRCGKGTYIRSLARDIARRLGTRGHLVSLRRFETSGFRVDEAIALDELDTLAEAGRLTELLVTPAAALGSMSSVTLTASEETDVRHGRAVPSPDALQGEGGEHVALLIGDGRLLAVARRDGDRLQPVRVLVG